MTELDQPISAVELAALRDPAVMAAVFAAKTESRSQLRRRQVMDSESCDSDVVTVFVGVQYANGAVRQYTAHRPLHFTLAVRDGENLASLGPGMAVGDRMEPRIMLLFEGNPEAGGVEGYKEGETP